MKSKKKAVNYVTVLCDRCIRAIKSRGETIYVGDLLDDEYINSCMWCETRDDELFKVVFDYDGEYDADFDVAYNIVDSDFNENLDEGYDDVT